METLIVIIVSMIALRLIYELIKGIHNSKITRQYSRLNKGDKVIYREFDEVGIRNTPATVLWQNGPLVRIQPDEGGIEVTVERQKLMSNENH